MSETSFIKRFDITLDLKQPGCGGDFSVVDGDTGNVVYLALTDAGIPVSVEGRRIIAAFSNSRGKYMQDSAESGGGISISDDKVKLSSARSHLHPACGMRTSDLQRRNRKLRSGSNCL